MDTPRPNDAREAPFEPDSEFLLFLLIGQSNMEGAPAPEAVDLEPDERVRVLAYDDDAARAQTHDRWYVAAPPLHGSGVGPGDYFARTLLTSIPRPFRIGLVPCAINGVDIDYFIKGVVSKRRGEFVIPPDNHWQGAYEWVLERAQLAQRYGVIRGILFHQGESDNGDPRWIGKVQGLVRDLRADLELTESVPFLAGELYHDGACVGHNEQIRQLPRHIPNAHVVSAAGLGGMDRFHFDLAAQRELGRRYGQLMLELMRNPV